MTPQFRDIQQCRLWLDQNLTEGEGFAKALGELAQTVEQLRTANHIDKSLFEVVETIRWVISGPASRLVDRVAKTAEHPGAQTNAELLAFDGVMEQLQLAALASDKTLDANDISELHRSIPGTRMDTVDVLPLARALQIQSMRIIALLRTRAIVPDQFWHDLGHLAMAMRQSTFVDEPLSSDKDPDGNRTSRAWFVLPILMMIAALEERAPAQAALICRFAGYWADRVGFRIDSGLAIKANKYGPSIPLGEAYRVRLDTHRLRDSMVRRQAKWLQPQTESAGLPMGMSLVQLADLLEDLFVRWSPAWRSPKVREAPGGSIRMRFGLPSREVVISGRVAVAKNNSTYDYGQYQQLAVSPARVAGPAAKIAKQVLRGVDRGQWTFVDRQGVVVDRHCHGAVPELAGIVAFAIESDDQAQQGESKLNAASDDQETQDMRCGLRLGRVRAVQRVTEAASGSDLQRVAMKTFAGVPTPVEIEDGSGARGNGAYLLSGRSDDGQGSTLFAPVSRVAPGARLLLRRPEDEISVEVGSLVERGRDYEQFVVKARGSSTL